MVYDRRSVSGQKGSADYIRDKISERNAVAIQNLNDKVRELARAKFRMHIFELVFENADIIDRANCLETIEVAFNMFGSDDEALISREELQHASSS